MATGKKQLNQYVVLASGFWSITLIVFIGIVVLGLFYPQTPFSDFLIHWESSLDLRNYIKGGGAVILIKILSAFNITPALIGLILNSLSWLVFSIVIFAYLNQKNYFYNFNKLGFFSFLCLYLSFGWQWIGYGSTLAVMPLHLATIALGFYLIRFHPKLLILGLFVISISFSIRVQSAIGLMVGLIFMFFFMKRYSLIKIKEQQFLILIILAVVLGVLGDSALRSNSDLSAEINRTDRAQIYNGLISPFSIPRNCGGWSQENWDVAYENRDIPIYKILGDNFKEIASTNTLLGFSCKIKRQLNTTNYVWWIQKDSLTSTMILNKEPLLKSIAGLMDFTLKLSIFFFLVYIIIRFKQMKTSRVEFYISGSIFIGMLMLTTILEYNTRYSFITIGYFVLLVTFFISTIEKKYA